MEIKVKPIGMIHSPYKHPADIPKPKGYDPYKFDTTPGEIEVFTSNRPAGTEKAVVTLREVVFSNATVWRPPSAKSP